MARLSLKRHRFPADVIRHAVGLYFRCTLSVRAVDELWAQRGISVSYETVRLDPAHQGALAHELLVVRRAQTDPGLRRNRSAGTMD